MGLSQVVLNQMKFFYRKNDKFIGQRIALGKYEQYETKILLSQINKNSMVVDVGANIGYYTLLMAKVAKKVYAFEPDKDCFEILKKNVEENKLENVVLFNKAVGSRNKKVGIVRNEDNYGDSRVGKGNEVECVRLDDVIKEKVDLVKIDVQGYEIEVLEGMKNMVVPIIFMEIDKENIKTLNTKYKYVWSINDFAETPWPIWPGVQIKNSNGYADLWMKNKMSLNDYWTMLKNVKYKKFLKGIIGIWQK
ncbi:MAG: FkbM family methyltransferase [Candidatus Shapirobacteria bacterium]|nr:FkbM family methyltransferase [Candidatus Shapirobacteria bacterium]